MAETAIKNGKKNFANLQTEVNLLRSFLIGVAGKDSEGNYRPEFVRKIMRAAREKERFVFRDKNYFLSHLKKK